MADSSQDVCVYIYVYEYVCVLLMHNNLDVENVAPTLVLVAVPYVFQPADGRLEDELCPCLPDL
jgi:hypothetical protein